MGVFITSADLFMNFASFAITKSEGARQPIGGGQQPIGSSSDLSSTAADLSNLYIIAVDLSNVPVDLLSIFYLARCDTSAHKAAEGQVRDAAGG